MGQVHCGVYEISPFQKPYKIIKFTLYSIKYVKLCLTSLTFTNLNCFKPHHFSHKIILLWFYNDFPVDPWDSLTHILQGCITGARIQCKWGNPEGYREQCMHPSGELIQRSQEGYKHQNNTWVSAERVCHESAYIILFLTRHNECRTINTHRPRFSLTQFSFYWWHDNWLLMTSQCTMTRQLRRDHMNSDI